MIRTLAAGLDYADLQFLGRPGIIATAVLRGPAGVALVDPGPSTTIDTLKAALAERGTSVGEIRQLLLTHIHLDHAGATGTLVRENPDIEVLVHERGAPHMANPVRLIASATQLYGEAHMARLWGEFLPVPESNLRALTGGETITAAGRELEVAYTPGHASHHVSYFDHATRVAFVGDTAGIRRGTSTYVMPPTPPPDIDLDAWIESEARILAWDPDVLFLTHFGPFHGPGSSSRSCARTSRRGAGSSAVCSPTLLSLKQQQQDAFVDRSAPRPAPVGRRAGGGAVRPRRAARLLLAGAGEILEEALDLTASAVANPKLPTPNADRSHTGGGRPGSLRLEVGSGKLGVGLAAPRASPDLP